MAWMSAGHTLNSPFSCGAVSGLAENAHLQEQVVLPTPPFPPTKIHFKDLCCRMLRRVGSSEMASVSSPILAAGKRFCASTNEIEARPPFESALLAMHRRERLSALHIVPVIQAAVVRSFCRHVRQQAVFHSTIRTPALGTAKSSFPHHSPTGLSEGVSNSSGAGWHNESSWLGSSGRSGHNAASFLLSTFMLRVPLPSLRLREH